MTATSEALLSYMVEEALRVALKWTDCQKLGGAFLLKQSFKAKAVTFSSMT